MPASILIFLSGVAPSISSWIAIVLGTQMCWGTCYCTTSWSHQIADQRLALGTRTWVNATAHEPSSVVLTADKCSHQFDIPRGITPKQLQRAQGKRCLQREFRGRAPRISMKNQEARSSFILELSKTAFLVEVRDGDDVCTSHTLQWIRQ